MTRQRDCLTCGESFAYTRTTARYCSPRCRYHYHLLHTRRQRIPDNMRYAILLAAGFRCVLCGASPADDNKTKLTVDHIVSVSKGGAPTDMRNLRCVCHACNSGKSDTDEG